ncbi:Hypothetical predicted protein [Paramuricea clavata]|uniref:DDE Tnp4 domain-containing protein n=1 Tax=Paramuricea clavata TaxID=317549 RepID=A0A7D9KE16_PARCT|nr:Hypothetical predicted protein [Paramuricea clavata]
MDEIFDTLLLSYDDGLISDEELLLLQDYLCISPNRHSNFPYRGYNPFDWENLDELTCKFEFRFDKQDIPRLQEALQFPEMISIPHATDCPGLEALCILLKRFAYPVRYCDMVPMFGRSVPELCKITQYAINHITTTMVSDYKAGINHFYLQRIWNPMQMQFMSKSICIPNGLIANLSGPWEERMHDARILGESGLMQDLRQHAFAQDGTPMCLYGDPAYPLRVHLQQPFRNNAALTEDMRQYNKAMSSVRVSVEWLFGEITKYFKFVDFKQQHKIRLSPIGKIYIVSAILQNSLACLYGNIVSEYFEINPPTLENYFWRADA